MRKIRVFRNSNIKSQVRKKRTKLFFRGTLATLALVLLIFGIRYFSLHLEQLKLKTVQIEGAVGPITQALIRQQAQVQEGDPLFSIPLKEIVSRLKQNPWIDQAIVSRKLPHTLLIQVGVHEPKLILQAKKFYYIGKKGEIFKEVRAKQDSFDYPFFTGLTREEMEQDPPQAREIIAQALVLLSAYEAQLKPEDDRISEIHYDAAGGFEFYTEKDHLRVFVGFDRFEEKLKNYDRIIAQMKKLNQNFAAVDLNYDGKVILTL